MRQTEPSPEINGTLDREDSEVDAEGRMSDARFERIWASIRAYFEQWNRHIAAEVFADIEAVARERDDADAQDILGDIRLVRGAIAIGDARLAELAFRVGTCAQAADLMPDAKRGRAVRARNRRNNERRHSDRQEYWVPWQKADRELRAAGVGITAARKEIGNRMSEAGHDSADESTLRKWLTGYPMGYPYAGHHRCPMLGA